jgi:hypothetical protein
LPHAAELSLFGLLSVRMFDTCFKTDMRFVFTL